MAYDVTPAIAGNTGVARCTMELGRALEHRGLDLARYAYGRAPYPVPPDTAHSAVPLRVVHLLWERFGRPHVERLTGPVDLVHVLDMAPPPARAPIALTVHDLDALDLPELHSGQQQRQQERQLAAATAADLVFANSGVVADALRRHGVGTRIVVTPLAPTALRSDSPGPVTGRYVLTVGALVRRKDVPTLVAGFLAADLPDDVRLVVAGPDGDDAERVRALAGDRVIVLGLVDDETLAALYRDALVYATASRAEGTNLPVLEAMAAGLPVVASDLPIVHEVAGDAARVVPTGDVDAWSAALAEVITDDGLSAGLARAGRARAAERSWDRTAELVADGYHLVLG